MAVALVLLTGELRRFRKPARAVAVTMLVVVVLADLAYGWAAVSTDHSKWARMILWQESDVLDYRRFPVRPIGAHRPTSFFRRATEGNRISVETMRVRESGHVVEHELEEFLRSTGTTAFVIVKGDTLVYEDYFNGYRRDSTVTSFSVAKPFVSALVGIAIADGHIGSVDDPVTDYPPELAGRDPKFNRITLSGDMASRWVVTA